MNELLDYVRKHFKELPANRWKGKSASGQAIAIKEHHAGVDFSRGPWVKFLFTEGGTEREIQGFVTKKGDRIKFGGKGSMKECDDDELDYTFAGDVLDQKAVVILKFKFEQDGDPRSYRFEGKTN